MSRGRVLAVVTAEGLDAGATEFLRICVGCLAGGHRVELRDLGDRADPLAERAPPRARAWLAALMAEGVLSSDGQTAEAGGLHAALRACSGVLRLADEARSGAPALLVIDDAYLATVDDAQLRADLANAGQVIRS